MLNGLRLLVTTDAVGGIWTYALDLGAGLAEHGARVTLAVLGPIASARQRAEAEALGLDLRHLAAQPEWLASNASELADAAERLAALARAMSADLIHLNHPALAAFGPLPAPTVGVAHSCVATWWAAVRGTPLPEDFAWRTRLVAAGYRAVDRLVAPTSAFAQATAQAYRLAEPPTVVHNGRRPPSRIEDGGPGGRVFSAGRLWDEGKGAIVLDEAAALLPCPVELAGPCKGPNGASIALRHATPLGELPPAGVAAQLARRPLFASPALYEPFGLSVLEAAQAGCALVLSDIPTFRELWGGAALFVASRDPRAWADAIQTLLADKEARTALAEAAVTRADRYPLDVMIDAVAALYMSLRSSATAISAP